MSEWVVLAYMLSQWILSLNKTEKKNNTLAYRMLMITDVWIFINILIAVLISIPSFNHFTHGTHVTVAHSMGTTIGINTPILLASVMFFLSRITKKEHTRKRSKLIFAGMLLFNISLFVFLSSLIGAGFIKGQWMYSENANIYSELMEEIMPYLYIFVASGFVIFLSLVLMVVPLLKTLFREFKVQ